MAPSWIDETSYNRDERGRIEPQTYALNLPDLRIVVTRRFGCGRAWFLDCEQASFCMRDLSTRDISEAKVKALRLVRDRLAKIADYARHACEWQENATTTEKGTER